MAGFRGLFVKKTTVGTQAVEARKSLAGLLVPSSVLGARQGILAGPGDPLRVTGTASWQYSVNAGPVTTSRSDSDGSMLFGNDGTALTPAVSAAPGSGSRYDLIYIRHLDPDQGEGDPSVVIGVVEGVASGSPVKPAVPAGAFILAESLMAAGATSTNHANVTITQVAPKTVARGGILPVATSADLPATGYEGMRAVETTGASQGQEWEWRAGGWKWPKAAQGRLAYSTRVTAAGPVNTTPAVISGIGVTVVIPTGMTRRVRVGITGQAYGTVANSTGVMAILKDGATVRTSTTQFPVAANGAGYATSVDMDLAAGTYVFTLRLSRGAGTGDVFLDANATNPLEMYADDRGAA